MESDLAGYRLYRGSNLAFVPGPGNLIATLTDTDYSDAFGTPAIYKLSAIDIHGNESPFAVVVPDGTVDVGDPAPSVLALSGVRPNPIGSSGRVHFSLGREGDVLLTVVDVTGRQVAEVARGRMAAGSHVVRWSGEDTRGKRLAAGVYFLRLVAEDRLLTQRIVLTP